MLSQPSYVLTLCNHHNLTPFAQAIYELAALPFHFCIVLQFFVVTKNVAYVARPEKEEEHRWPSSLRWPFCVFSLLPHPIAGCHTGYIYIQIEKQNEILLWFICSLDACSFHECKSYQDCVVNNNAAKCQCPRKCPSTNKPVCASNGKSYKSECYMRVKACKNKKDLVVVRKGNCGKCISNRRKFLITYVVLAARPLMWKKKQAWNQTTGLNSLFFVRTNVVFFLR